MYKSDSSCQFNHIFLLLSDHSLLFCLVTLGVSTLLVIERSYRFFVRRRKVHMKPRLTIPHKSQQNRIK